MDFKKISKRITIGIIIFILVLVIFIFVNRYIGKGSKDCVTDSDCVVYGEPGDCNCGCYNKDNLPGGSGGSCFCAPPEACECRDGKCTGVLK